MPNNKLSFGQCVRTPEHRTGPGAGVYCDRNHGVAAPYIIHIKPKPTPLLTTPNRTLTLNIHSSNWNMTQKSGDFLSNKVIFYLHIKISNSCYFKDIGADNQIQFVLLKFWISDLDIEMKLISDNAVRLRYYCNTL